MNNTIWSRALLSASMLLTVALLSCSGENADGSIPSQTPPAQTPSAVTAVPTQGAGHLTGSLTPITTPQAFNLTALGATDWAAWGDSGFDHSATGGSKIGNVTTYGGGSLNSFDSSVLGMTWANGSPMLSATNETKGYYNAGGIGDGFIFTVPASTTVHTLTVFVGGYTSAGTLHAGLSDGSAPLYTDSSLAGPSISYYGYYTLTFKAASPNQTLVVVWKEASGAPTGNLTIYAAALH